MPRTVHEWIGKTPDTAIPARVKLRIFDAFNGHCVRCGGRIGGRIRPAYDHRIAIINGGENRESNIDLLCSGCHGPKTASDVRTKAKIYRTRTKHVGIARRKRLIPGSKGSGFRKRMDGTVERE